MLDLPLTMPEALGGKGEAAGTNPEELFAAANAACPYTKAVAGNLPLEVVAEA